ncbi:MAG: endonuclease/exonuclease/phosphatase family protein [Xanthomonadaceae bacterium]|nr:endonuclease/exonuclease/phosphatase family protein [Xanthomonadaceae bacterium]
MMGAASKKLVFFIVLFLSAESLRADELRVLTLNTWFLSVLGFPVGKDQKKRLKILPDLVLQQNADVLVFQEAWPNRKRQKIAFEMARRGYPYHFFVKRKVTMGDGLEIVSRYPIVDAQASPHYSVATKFEERFARKRSIMVEIEMPSGERIDVVTTHMGALNYKEGPGTYKAEHRARQHIQFNELKSWIMRVKKNRKMIVAGDLNSDYRKLVGGKFLPEFDPVYSNFLRSACGGGEDLLNTFLSFTGITVADPGDPTYSQDNPYAKNGMFSNFPSETEDYIFSCGFTPEQIKESKVVFKEDLSIKRTIGSTRPKRLSDHYGVVTTFSW